MAEPEHAPVWAMSPCCPWCGDEALEDVEDVFYQMSVDGRPVETECDGCGKPIRVTRREIVTYLAEGRSDG